MTNQKYIKEIIKLAIEGEYKSDILGCFTNSVGDVLEVRLDQLAECAYLFLDKDFWRAIGKVKGWNDENKWRMIGGFAHKIDMETGKYIPVWIYHALTFHEINLKQDLDHAIEWLYNLIKE